MSATMQPDWYRPHGAEGGVGSVEAIDATRHTGPLNRESAEESHWWRPDVFDGRPDEDRTAGSDIDQGSAIPFWSLMAFTAILLFSPQQYFPSLAIFRPALLAIGVGIGFFLLDRSVRRLPIVEWTLELKLIVVMVAWATVTIPFSLWPGGSISVLVDTYLKAVAVFWLLSHVVTTSRRLRQIAGLLTLFAMGLGLFAMNSYLSGVSIDQGISQDRIVGNEGGLTKNPNDLALMINLIIPLTIGLLLVTTPALIRSLLICAIVIEVITVILTHSRGGALTLGAIVLLYAWKLKRRPERTWLYGLMLAGLLALPLVPSSYLDRMSTIANMQTDRTGSAQERWYDMAVAAKTILAHPVIGAGIGMNTLAMNEARGGWLPVHNVYLEHALDLGLPGLIVFCFLLVSCIRGTVSAQKKCQASGMSDVRVLAEALQVSLLAFATAAMFHPVSYHMYFYYMAGLSVAVWKISRTESRRWKEISA
ncbi:MAG: O-antigen ligase family protein [Nitrospirae bacterium]|nr:O-antigen ligase family protein [Nitrospirota bacterium]